MDDQLKSVRLALVGDWDLWSHQEHPSGRVAQAAGIRVRLTGPPGADKAQLIGAAAHLRRGRLFGIGKDCRILLGRPKRGTGALCVAVR